MTSHSLPVRKTGQSHSIGLSDLNRSAREKESIRERLKSAGTSAMKNPVHPGAIVREDCLKPLALSVSEGARRLGVGRQTLSHLVNEKASVSIEMAYRLSKAFGSTPETWLGMQLAFDLAQSRHLQQEINVERIVAA